MPKLTYYGSDLVRAIRDVGMIPDTGATGVEDDDLLRAASEGIREYLLAEVASTQEEYFTYRSRTPLVGGQAVYDLPDRAMWQQLRDLWFFNGSSRFKLTPAPEEEMHAYGISTGSQATSYLFEGNSSIRLVPDLSSTYSGFLEFVYFARPGDIVLEEEGRQIPVGGIDTVTKTITFADPLPTSWVVTDTFDVHSSKSGAQLKLLGVSVSGVGSNSLTFTDAIDGSVFGTKAPVAGDWICLEGEAVLPGLPAEFHPIVARVAALVKAESLGDTEKVQLHGKLIETFLKRNIANTEQRNKAKPWRVGASSGMLGRSRIYRRW